MTKQETIEATATEVVENKPAALPAFAQAQLPAATTPMEMIGQAVAAGAGAETLNGLMDLQERWEDRQAKKAYNAAISAARAEIGPIAKNRKVDFTSQKGRTSYAFEDLAEIARTVDPILAQHGLSYRWRTEQNGNTVRVTCVVSHLAGYAEGTSLEAQNDNSGNKNAIQGVGSTVTFLQRYTLKAALGLAVAHDDDGQAGGRSAAPAELTASQAKVIRDLLTETAVDEFEFLKYAKAESVETIARPNFKKVKAALETKRKKAEAADEEKT